MAKSVTLLLLFAFICNFDNRVGPRSVQAANRQQQRRQEENRQNRRQQQQQQQQQRSQGGGSRQQKNSGPDDPYKILGVKKNAKDKEIKSAYRKLALKYHVRSLCCLSITFSNTLYIA